MRSGIKKVPWDGYLKYHRPSPKLTEKKYTTVSFANVNASIPLLMYMSCEPVDVASFLGLWR